MRPAAAPGEILAEDEPKRVHVRQVRGEDQRRHSKAGLLLEPRLRERCACQTMCEIIQVNPFDLPTNFVQQGVRATSAGYLAPLALASHDQVLTASSAASADRMISALGRNRTVR